LKTFFAYTDAYIKLKKTFKNKTDWAYFKDPVLGIVAFQKNRKSDILK